jgi:hypothetical protein
MVISAGGTMMKTMMREMEEKNQHAGGGDYSSFGLYILFIIISSLSLSALHGVHTHNTLCIFIPERERERDVPATFKRSRTTDLGGLQVRSRACRGD